MRVTCGGARRRAAALALAAGLSLVTATTAAPTRAMTVATAMPPATGPTRAEASGTTAGASGMTAGASGRTAGAPGMTAGASGTTAGAPRWRWPVDPPHVVTRPFEAPASAYAPGHRGIDLTAEPGAVVRAPADGTVSFAGVVVDRPLVSIQHAGGLVSSLEPVVPTVAAGDVVVAGQVVGTVPDAPRHEPDGGVHLGARLHGEYVDPAPLLAALRHAVLLPLDP